MPRKSKKAGDDDSESAPVRRSTRARKSVLVNEDPEDFDLEPPKKVARGKRTSSWNTKDDEFDPDDDNDEEEKSTRTPVKGRGRGRKPAEHKDTPAPSRIAPKGRGKKRQQAESLKEEDSLSEGQETDSKPLPPSTPKKAKREEKVPTKETDDVEESAQSEAHSADAKKNTPKKNVAEDAEKESTPSDTTKDSKSKVVTPEKKTNEKVSPSTDASKDSHQSVSSKGDESASKENGVKSAEVKEPSGKESNAAVGSLKDVTVATAVLDGPKETKETLEKLENPDIVAAQKSTSASAEAAKTCG